MNWIRNFLTLLMAALLMAWGASLHVRAQDSAPAQPESQNQPVNPDAPPPVDNTQPAPPSDQPQPAGAGSGQPAAGDQPGGIAPGSAPENPQSDADTAAGQAQEDAPPAVEAAAGQAQEDAPLDADATAGEEEGGESEQRTVEGNRWTEDELSKTYQPHPTSVRVAVLDTSGRARGAGLITFLLEEYRKKHLESKIGKLISVVNQSVATGGKLKNSIIFYRPGHLRAALIMADVIPGKQSVKPIVPESTPKIGVDVEIRVGMELP